MAEQKKLAWEEKKCAFRKLTANERFVAGNNPISNGACGGNARHTGGFNPYYGSGRTTTPSTTKQTKLITRAVSETWEQKIPIETMSEARRGFLGELCEKLKHAFNVYNNNFCGGGRAPIRGDYDEWGYDEDMAGMAAYRHLMAGDMWGCYD